ncbi:MAG: PhnD/SsuA/transferrin family substrate-binding protein [bacterium]
MKISRKTALCAEMLFAILMLVLLAPVLAHASAPQQPAAIAKPKYTLVTRLGYGQEQDAQIVNIVNEILKIVAAELGFEFSNSLLLTDEDYMKAAKAGKFDFAFAWSHELVADTLKCCNYEPIVRINMFGAAPQTGCIYVNKDSAIKTVADLKNKTAATYQNAPSFYLLRKMVGKNPAEFFSLLKSSPNAISSIYAVALGESDSAFVYRANVEHLKIMNPGPAKKVRELVCIDDLLSIPLLASTKVPKQTSDKIVEILCNARKDPNFKNIRPLLIQSKAQFMPVKKGEYDGLLNLIAFAKKNGWDKEHKAWLAIAQKKDKTKK